MADLTLRRYRASDLEKLKAIHWAQGFAYEMPSLGQFSYGAIVANGHGADTGIFFRRTAETYLLLDPDLSPEAKMLRLKILDDALPPILEQQGIVETYAMIPPELEGKFQKRLSRLGWRKQEWPMWSRQIGG